MNLGELETLVLKTIWSLNEGSVKAVYEQVQAQRDVTQNTVQSTLERLYRKQLLQREKQGHAFIYRSALTREELTAKFLLKLMHEFESDPSLTLAAFIDQQEELSATKLDQLNRLVEQMKLQDEAHD